MQNKKFLLLLLVIALLVPTANANPVTFSNFQLTEGNLQSALGGTDVAISGNDGFGYHTSAEFLAVGNLIELTDLTMTCTSSIGCGGAVVTFTGDVSGMGLAAPVSIFFKGTV